MNPYDFVCFGRPAPRKQVAFSHERFGGHSGSLACWLTARTHLFIPGTPDGDKGSEGRRREDEHQELTMMRGANGSPLLPGSSLKGVLRSVAEAISGSCLTLPLPRGRSEVEYRDRPPVGYRVPPGFERCRDREHLCPACRLFGWLSGGDHFLGKVSIGDVVAVGEAKPERLTIEALMEPKPRHRAWYGDPGHPGTMRGRKFYRHRPAGPRTTMQKTRYNKTIEVVPPGAVFEFAVEYTNLTDDELALLVFALTLEPEMCHKVGMGKPLGLGSAKVEVRWWECLDRAVRYERLGGGVTTVDGEALAGEISQWRECYHELYGDWKDSLADLRRIWAWDAAVKEDVKYPPREWFQKNPKAPLDQAP